MLQITPNGSWGRDRHPALPLTTTELLADVRACLLAGADGVHLHPRDAEGRETLRPDVVNDTCAAVREVATGLGEPVEIGLTTGAWIQPCLAERIAMIREWDGVDCATVNVSEPGFELVMATLIEAGIEVDAGVWAAREVATLSASGLLGEVARVSIELSPGEPYRHPGEPRALSRKVNERLDEAGSSAPRLTHGDGAFTWTLVVDAFERGHATRVGFEDDVHLPDGRMAADNADLVRAAVALRSATASR